MDQEAMLKRIKNTISKHIRVDRVYLFGSRARGDHKRDSDFDIAIISPDFKKLDFDKRQHLTRPLIRKVLGVVSLDVACYTKEEFDQGKNGFLPGIIEEEGIAV